MAKKKVEKVEETVVENISFSSLDQVMCDDYAIYAKYVIQNRAIPDVRDGLKPVQRRIIYSMYESGYLFHKPTKKCARIVGDVMGKYHPHGDSSIYEALARMSQNWKINMNLIDFQGNNGSIDGDGPAAYRYTEARLAPLAEELVRDLEKETVDMDLNFDDTLFEPSVLPAHFPNLLLNGTEGIAVAMATEIPPHNLRELVEATIYRINHPHCGFDELLSIIKGPDFPTGGHLLNSEGIRNIYTTGKGKIDIRAKYEIIEEKDRNLIVISEIPYKVIKKDISYAIDTIRQKKEIDGIIEVIDATEMHQIKIIVSLKKDVDPNIVMNYLLQKTPLQTSYSANMVAIVNGRPETLNICTYLDSYIAHQQEVTTRRTRFDLAKDKKRLNVVDGLIKAISILDEVIETIRASHNKSDAKNNIIAKFGFNEEQAEAIVNLQLYRLTNTDVTKLQEEAKSLRDEIEELNYILNDPKKLNRVIISDLKFIANKYGIDRKTEIIDANRDFSIDKRDLILKEDVMLAVTTDGYIKCSSFKSYKSSNSVMPGIKGDDVLVAADTVNTGDFILSFTNKGNFIFTPVHEIQDGKWKDEGKNINYLTSLSANEKIIKTIGVEEFIDNVYIVTVSKRGQIKRTLLKEFVAQRYSKPICSMKLLKNDELADVAFTSGNSDLLVVSSNGLATLFNENELTPLGNKTAGVKSLNNIKEGHIVSLITFEQDERAKLLLLTDKGNLRICDSGNVEKTERLGKTTVLFKTFKYDPHSLIACIKLGKEVVSKNLETKLLCITKDNKSIEVSTNDYHLTPMDKYAKTNIEIDENVILEKFHNFAITYIKKDMKTYAPTPVEVKKPQFDSGDDDEFIQISIFDELGD